jgi:hypothetical protein
MCDYLKRIYALLAADEITKEKATWLTEKVGDYYDGKISKQQLEEYFNVPF